MSFTIKMSILYWDSLFQGYLNINTIIFLFSANLQFIRLLIEKNTLCWAIIIVRKIEFTIVYWHRIEQAKLQFMHFVQIYFVWIKVVNIYSKRATTHFLKTNPIQSKASAFLQWAVKTGILLVIKYLTITCGLEKCHATIDLEILSAGT